MIDIKFMAWHKIMKVMSQEKDPCNDFEFIINGVEVAHDCSLDHAVFDKNIDLIISTGITSPCGREIWFGDFYYNAGYGNLHINTMADIVTLMEGLTENDIGAYLGNQYENPELLEDES
jgi:hypothetical protein